MLFRRIYEDISVLESINGSITLNDKVYGIALFCFQDFKGASSSKYDREGMASVAV